MLRLHDGVKPESEKPWGDSGWENANIPAYGAMKRRFLLSDQRSLGRSLRGAAKRRGPVMKENHPYHRLETKNIRRRRGRCVRQTG